MAKREAEVPLKAESEKATKSEASSASSSGTTYRVYTLKAIYGDPTNPIPSWMKTQKKEKLQEQMKREGYAQPLKGSKEVLLQRYVTELPFVTMRIDESECMQRVLNVALSTWGYDEAHMFQMKMPRRGGNLLGCKKYGNGNYSDVMIIVQMYLEGRIPDHEIARWRKSHKEIDPATMDGLLNGTITPNHYLPHRVFQGNGARPGALRTGREEEFEEDQGGALTLRDVALEVGDRINVVYDFGDSHNITICVEAIDDESSQLPVHPFRNSCGDHSTRAAVISRGGRAMRSQYQRDDEESGGADESDHGDY